ncbi:hypothetical protein, partial [Campylobacter concisus]|uniref:hypothetical protein n=1 Tax=Campylobacter concisus TaxID=199 RepID=UPI001CB7BA98
GYICIYNVGWLQCHKGINIKFGDGNLQTEAEARASIFTGIVQAVADSMNSKDNKDNKDDKK